MTSETTSEMDGWEVVIGLEVHAELATATKLFSGARNEFGGEPNTHVDPVSLGFPALFRFSTRRPSSWLSGWAWP
jgi:aspartyl-tRNA(Asn)/glutamyl-tRNA(Gln) amidotransferase subunit B